MITVNVPSLNISDDGASALYAWMMNQQNAGFTSLSVDCTSLATTITVEDASGIGIAGNNTLLVGGEVMLVTLKTGKVLTVTRAQLGTMAAAHKGKVVRIDKGETTVMNIGDQITVLKYNTISRTCRQWIVDKLTELMNQGGYPSAVTQDSIINAAKIAKDAAIAGAIV